MNINASNQDLYKIEPQFQILNNICYLQEPLQHLFIIDQIVFHNLTLGHLHQGKYDILRTALFCQAIQQQFLSQVEQLQWVVGHLRKETQQHQSRLTVEVTVRVLKE